jgi:hypothetical protein
LAGSLPPTVTRLDAVLATPSVRDRLAGLGGEAGAFSPEEYTAFVRPEVARW